MFRKIACVIVMCLLSGCATPPTQEEVANFDYGPYPTRYEKIIKEYYGRVLKDPSSAQYKNFTTPRTYWFSRPPLAGGGTLIGHMVCVTYNAKNSYGAYTGYDTDLFLIHSGVVVKYIRKATNYFGRNLCTA